MSFEGGFLGDEMGGIGGMGSREEVKGVWVWVDVFDGNVLVGFFL